MFLRSLVFVGATLVSFSSSLSFADIWIGDLSKTSERGSSSGRYTQCSPSNIAQGQTIVFDDWDLTRAIVHNLCFRVYAAGLTDAGGSPGDLSVVMSYKALGSASSVNPLIYPARFVGVEGNNFVYAFDVFDFYPSYGTALNGNQAKEIEFSLVARNVATHRDYGSTGVFVLKFASNILE